MVGERGPVEARPTREGAEHQQQRGNCTRATKARDGDGDTDDVGNGDDDLGQRLRASANFSGTSAALPMTKDLWRSGETGLTLTPWLRQGLPSVDA